MRIQKTDRTVLRRTLPVIAMMIMIVGVFFYAGATLALAADSAPDVPAASAETLSVDEVWLTGDVLHISVTDMSGGEKQTLELNLSDYAKPGDEYVSIQATNSAGRISNVIQFKNPYYVPPAAGGDTNESETTSGDDPTDSDNPTGDGGYASNGLPFTPDGTGSVVDNAADDDSKEFFTVETADGNIFYLIVDRKRNAENVYFLNAVTEEDLASLAKPGDGKTTEAPTTAPIVTPTPEQPAEPTPAEPPAEKTNNNTGAIALAICAAVLVGGGGWYFKIVRPKKEADDDYDSGYDEPDGDAELPIDDEREVDEE